MPAATVAREIMLPPLHDKQREIAKTRARFKVVVCGRRWGKTMLGMVICLAGTETETGRKVPGALQGGRWWWIAPTYQEGLEGWRYLMKLVAHLPNTGVKQVGLTVTFDGGGSIQVKTSDNPDNLRGAGLDGAVLDEAAVMKAETWEVVIRPALADRQGAALFITTPQHFNWVYELWSRGQDEAFPDWASWQLPSWTNPFIAEEEIEAARGEMTPEDFEQEFGASFTAIGGAVWPQLGTYRAVFLRPMPSDLEFARTGIGMDWGTTKAHNASVVCASMMKSGTIWYRSAWLDYLGGDAAWFSEAFRCKRDHGATFARVDRSQSSALDRLREMGFDAETGIAIVEARIGAYTSGFNPNRPSAYFDSNGPGIGPYFNHMCGYHRDRDGKIVEEEDDDVDAGGYVTIDLTGQTSTTTGILRVPRTGAGVAPETASKDRFPDPQPRSQQPRKVIGGLGLG